MNALQQKWREILENRKDYSHEAFPISEWKRAALAGTTRFGYADMVSEILVNNRPEIPRELLQFRPRTNFGKALQRAVVTEFEENDAVLVAKANGHGWFVMKHAYENLLPFIVAKGDAAFIVAKDTAENREDLRELNAATIYEWDGFVVPRYNDM